MKAYKGFNKDMTCKGFQYEEGKEYETGSAECCSSGFHACEYPLDVFRYYEPAKSVYHEVEQTGELSKSDEDSKVASTNIRIGARLDIPGLIKAAIEFTRSRTTTEHTDPNLANAGDCGAANAGDCGAANAGNRGVANAGYCGAAISRGSSNVGENGISVARGERCRVRGGKGAILVIAEEKSTSYDFKHWKAVIVDGEIVKADTWYCLKDGELVEVDEDE